MKRILMKVTMAGLVFRAAGEEYEVDAQEAKNLVAVGYAEYVEPVIEPEQAERAEDNRPKMAELRAGKPRRK